MAAATLGETPEWALWTIPALLAFIISLQ